MAIKFKGDMTKVIAKNKGDMTKTTLRKRVSTVISQILGGGSGISDLYTKMLLHFDDDAAAASFADAAQSPLTQTKFGTVATSTTQSKFGGKSLALNGVNTNKLQFANPKSGLQSTFNFGSQDFTMEGWFYITALTNQYQSLVEFYDPTMGGAAGPVLLINPSNRIAFHEDTNSYILATSITPVLNQWYHIAVVRKNNVITIYVNGSSAASSAFTATLRTSYAQCNIGNFPHVGGGYTSLNGYVDNVRVQLGEAVYSAGFTPQSAQFDDGKNCLLHFEGSNGSTTFTDSSTSPKTFTAYGTGTAISTTKSKFGSSSLYLPGGNGTGSRIASTASSDYAIGSGDFTVEFWANMSSYSSGFGSKYNCFFDTRNGSHNGLYLLLDSSKRLLAIPDNSMAESLTGSTVLQLNTWYHIVISRKGNTLMLYVDGKLDASRTVSFNLAQNGLVIGNIFDYYVAPGLEYNGYIDEFRFTKGVGLYSLDITPPTSAVTSNSYTKLLMNFDGANGSTSFVESSSGLTVNVQGNVTISTEQSKFGGSSLKMTGGNGSNGLKIDNRVTSNQPIYLNDNDWTMEGWFWFNQKNVGYQPLFSFSNDDGNYPGPQIFINSDNTLWYGHQNQGYQIASSFNPDANRWYHLAVSKSNTSIKLFVDGTQVGSTLTTPKTITTPSYVFLGVFAHAKSLNHFNGYIDGVRIQVGESLYNSNFTPSTTAPVANAYTKLLMNFEGSSISNDVTNALEPVLVGSGITVSSDRSKFGSKSLKMTGGTTDYLRAYNNSQPIALLDIPFTIEGWFWLNANNVGYQPLIMMASTGDFQGPLISTESNSTLTAYLSNGSSWAYPITTSFVPSANSWHHIALTRESVGGPIKLYCDGDLKGTNNTTASVFTSETLWIGHYPYYPGGARTLNGYVDDVRIVVGKATYPKYPDAWTPPVSQLTTTANTKLMLNFNSDSIDSSTNPATVIAYGGALLSSAQSKFGGNSMKFTRSTGSRLTVSNVGNKLQFGSSDFCIETWLYLNSMPGGSDYPNGYWIVGYGADNSADGFDYWIGTTNIICAPVSYYTQPINVAHGMTTGQWYHVALTRKGTSLNLFINGVLKAVSTITGPVYTIPSSGANANLIGIGSGEPSAATSGNFDGYMDDFRITIGDSVYGGVDFTPPTAPFALIG